MIIKDKSFLHSIDSVDDKMVFTHAQNIAPSLDYARDLREFSDNGWTKDRSLRQIGSIPELEFQKLMTERPDLAKDPSKLREWLMSDEGEQYRTVKAINTGKSGKIIVR